MTREKSGCLLLRNFHSGRANGEFYYHIMMNSGV
jgi:hypothetical protein